LEATRNDTAATASLTENRPGTVRIDGLVEGPTSSWNPSPDRLVEALRRVGSPEDALRVTIRGGRASLEPAIVPFLREEFAADPGEALALALDDVFREDAQARASAWFSTLRTTEYTLDRRRETLVTLDPRGIRTLVHEEPWSPPIARPRLGALAEHWPTALLVFLAAGAILYVERENARLLWHRATAILAPRSAEEIAAHAGAFADWIDLGVARDGEEVIVRVRPRESFPVDPVALDALRAGAPIERRAALAALETGRAHLRVEVDEGGEAPPPAEVDLRPLRASREQSVRIDGIAWAGRLRSIHLEP